MPRELTLSYLAQVMTDDYKQRYYVLHTCFSYYDLIVYVVYAHADHMWSLISVNKIHIKQ